MSDTTPNLTDALRTAAEFVLKYADDIDGHASEHATDITRKYPDVTQTGILATRAEVDELQRDLVKVMAALEAAGFTPPS